MADYYKDLFNRATLQNVANVIRNGGIARFEPDNFITREENANAKLEEVLKEYLPEKDYLEVDSAIGIFIDSLIEIYFNLGMKAGAQLQVQLLTNPENDYL